MEVFGLGKKELAELGLNFISIKVPVFPVLTRTYTMKLYFFVSKELLVKKLEEVDPLIIFDTTGVYSKQPKIDYNSLPDYIKMNGSGFYIRGVIDLPRGDWKILKDNIIESGDHNFTFDWDVSFYKDRDFIKAEKDKEKIKLNCTKYDKMEIEENISKPLRKNKVYIKKW